MKNSSIENLLKLNPYSLNKKKKRLFFSKQLQLLNKYHFKNSANYRNIIKKMNINIDKEKILENMPFIPTRIFKDHDFLSTSKKKIVKILKSSGTSANKPSKIYLDKFNANNQFKVLQHIVSSKIGSKRIPMLVIDNDTRKLDRSQFGARIAAINGFSIFASDIFFLLKNDQIDYVNFQKFINKYKDTKIFVFGFTFKIYETLVLKYQNKGNNNLNLKNSILIHGGGWKKLEHLKISNIEFKRNLQKKFKMQNIYNYYGLVEQTGSIFFECDCGFMVTSNYSEVLIRNENFKVVEDGNYGFIQLMSLLPTSYPGHNILTEDIGCIINEKCKCKIKGKKFLIKGRVENAEIRGCSDV